jgi:NADH:ubiquinone oxidoreductase subunit 6 (subunit J)
VNGEFTLLDLAFYGVAALTVLTGAYAVFSRNIVRAVFSLLGTFFGVAVLYGFLAADFVAVIQVLVYVGGILVLMIFAVMLSEKIETAARSNRAGGVILGGLVGIALLVFLISLALQGPWIQAEPGAYEASTASIGKTLLGEALLPFEVLSVVLLGVVIGAVVIARFKKSEEAD